MFAVILLGLGEFLESAWFFVLALEGFFYMLANILVFGVLIAAIHMTCGG